MTLRVGVCVVALCFTASPLLADEVLYCTDTAVIGFKWGNKSAALVAKFQPLRYTVAVKSVTERNITPTVSDVAGQSLHYRCHETGPPDGQIACVEDLGGIPWVFYKKGYTRAFLAGPPAGGDDPNISVAYGTCTKF